MTAIAIHSLAALIPAMLTDELAALERDIEAHGQQQPITLYDGKILDGRHRYAVCQKLNIAPKFTTFDGTEAEAKALVLSLNVHRRHLTFEQKEKLIEAELQRDPGQSDRMIAEKVKASPTSVGKVRAKAEADGKVSTVDTITGKDGVQQPRKPTKAMPPPREGVDFAKEVSASFRESGQATKAEGDAFYKKAIDRLYKPDPSADSITITFARDAKASEIAELILRALPGGTGASALFVSIELHKLLTKGPSIFIPFAAPRKRARKPAQKPAGDAQATTVGAA